MENPSTWKRAELVLSDIFQEIGFPGQCGIGCTGEDCSHCQLPVVIGASYPSVVANRLRMEGVLDDSAEPEIGWEGLRAHNERKTNDTQGQAQGGSPLEER